MHRWYNFPICESSRNFTHHSLNGQSCNSLEFTLCKISLHLFYLHANFTKNIFVLFITAIFLLSEIWATHSLYSPVYIVIMKKKIYAILQNLHLPQVLTKEMFVKSPLNTKVTTVLIFIKCAAADVCWNSMWDLPSNKALCLILMGFMH